MSRIFIIALLSVLFGCAVQSNPATFQGEPLFNPADSGESIATIDRQGQPAVIMTYSESDVGIGIFQAHTGEPYLTLRDSNGDGVFDLLTYASLSASGEWLGEVEDYGMDGQPDFILNSKKKTATVFYNGNWHPVSGLGSGSGATVSIDGETVPLKEILTKLGRGAF